MYYLNDQLDDQQNNYLHEPLIFPKAITKRNCDRWVDQLANSNLEIVKGDLQDEDNDEDDRTAIDPSVRIVNKREFSEEDTSPIIPEIFAELEVLFLSANKYYKFDIHGIDESVNLLHYKHFPEGAGHYVGHTDFGEGGLSTRKLTCIIQLSDAKVYSGCDLVLPDFDDDVPREKGTAIVFPSYMYHKVNPIKRGERYCINAWCAGPPFR